MIGCLTETTTCVVAKPLILNYRNKYLSHLALLKFHPFHWSFSATFLITVWKALKDLGLLTSVSREPNFNFDHFWMISNKRYYIHSKKLSKDTGYLYSKILAVRDWPPCKNQVSTKIQRNRRWEIINDLDFDMKW